MQPSIITPIDQLPVSLRTQAMGLSYLTEQDEFFDVSRGKPLPHTLDDANKTRAGMTRETWRLEVVAADDANNPNPDVAKHPCELGNPLTTAGGNALTFDQLLAMGERCKSVYPKLMTCLNIADLLGMGVWEGVLLRDVIELTQPAANYRRVTFAGYHNDDPGQLFRSSMSVSRALEAPPGFAPVILAYKLNGDWISSERGGPVRLILPESYGYKNIKWLNRIELTNDYRCNDTYATWNNDPDTAMKSCAQINRKKDAPDLHAGEPFVLTGYAQVGLNGISRVQVAAIPAASLEAQGPDYDGAPWIDAHLLPPPTELLSLVLPDHWPHRFAALGWVVEHPPLAVGEWELICRTVDERGEAQPRPRVYQKSGQSRIRHYRARVV